MMRTPLASEFFSRHGRIRVAEHVKRILTVTAGMYRRVPYYSGVVTLLTIAAGVLPLASIWLSKLVVDSMIGVLRTPSASLAVELLLLVLLLQLVLGLFMSLLNNVNSYYSSKVTTLTAFSIQEDTYRMCLRMDYPFFESSANYDRLSRVMGQSTMATTALFTTLLQLSKKLLFAGSVVVVIFVYSRVLFIGAVVVAVPGMLLRIRLAQRNYGIMVQRAERERRSGYFASLLTVREYVRDSMLFGLGRHFFGRWQELQKKTDDENLDILCRETRISYFAECLNMVAVLFSTVFIVHRSAASGDTLGTVLMYIACFSGFSSTIQGLSQDWVSLYRNLIHLNDYFELKQMIPATEKEHCGVTPNPKPTSIRFEGVSFKYPGCSTYALKNVSFEIRKGESVCLVGKNGAGKSTLVKLLGRLYEPSSGAIYLDDKDLRDYDVEALRKSMGVLTQDFSKYLLTVRENIALGCLDRENDLESAQRAARIAGLDSRVERLPDGLDSVLGKVFGNGEDLSIGEWQRLGVARVLFRNSPILILDEPNSWLDAESEARIMRHFWNLSRRRICILVSHRLMATKHADRIMVLDSGGVIEDGSHERLMEASGIYAELFRLQSGKTGDDKERGSDLHHPSDFP